MYVYSVSHSPSRPAIATLSLSFSLCHSLSLARSLSRARSLSLALSSLSLSLSLARARSISAHIHMYVEIPEVISSLDHSVNEDASARMRLGGSNKAHQHHHRCHEVKHLHVLFSLNELLKALKRSLKFFDLDLQGCLTRTPWHSQ